MLREWRATHLLQLDDCLLILFHGLGQSRLEQSSSAEAMVQKVKKARSSPGARSVAHTLMAESGCYANTIDHIGVEEIEVVGNHDSHLRKPPMILLETRRSTAIAPPPFSSSHPAIPP